MLPDFTFQKGQVTLFLTSWLIQLVGLCLSSTCTSGSVCVFTFTVRNLSFSIESPNCILGVVVQSVTENSIMPFWIVGEKRFSDTRDFI